MLPGVSTLSLVQFMGDLTSIWEQQIIPVWSIESVASIDFTLKPNTEKIKVLFLITSESVENPIFRYDLIEHLVTTTNDSKTFYALMSTFPHIPSERADTVALIIKKVTEIRDLLGDLKVIKRTIIPSNSIVKVNCKKNFEFETKEKSVIFQPLIDSQADKILEFRKSYETTRKGKTPHVSIYITNLSNRKIVL